MVSRDVMIFRKDVVTILIPGPNLTRVTDGNHEYWVKTGDLKPTPPSKPST
jgi:hypothetical protein